jgi:predicted N-acetyltransferase YhbS
LLTPTSSPISTATLDSLRGSMRYHEHNITLVAEDDNGDTLAEATAIPMSQNVRGAAYPMAGIAGVASLPLARRQGHVRGLLVELLGRMRDQGYVVSALYPFRPSFYQRFGYVGLPKARTVTFAPDAFADLLHTDLDGAVSWEPTRDGYEAFRALTRQLADRRHGFAVLPEYRTAELRDSEDRWLVTARSGGAVIGAMAYRITGHGGELVGEDLLTTGPLGRALILHSSPGTSTRWTGSAQPSRPMRCRSCGPPTWSGSPRRGRRSRPHRHRWHVSCPSTCRPG